MKKNYFIIYQIWSLFLLFKIKAIHIPISFLYDSTSISSISFEYSPQHESIKVAVDYVSKEYNCSIKVFDLSYEKDTFAVTLQKTLLNANTLGTIVSSFLSPEECEIAELLSTIYNRTILTSNCPSNLKKRFFKVGISDKEIFQVICSTASSLSTSKVFVLQFSDFSLDFSLNDCNITEKITFTDENQLKVLLPTIKNQLEFAVLVIFCSPSDEVVIKRILTNILFNSFILFWGRNLPFNSQLKDGDISISIAQVDSFSYKQFRNYFFNQLKRVPLNEDFVIFESIKMLCKAVNDESNFSLSSSLSSSLDLLSTFVESQKERNTINLISNLAENKSDFFSLGSFNLETKEFSTISSFSNLTFCRLSNKLKCKDDTKIKKSTLIGSGYALFFDGINDIIEIKSQSFTELTEFTLSAWIQIPSCSSSSSCSSCSSSSCSFCSSTSCSSLSSLSSNKMLILGHPVGTGPVLYLERESSTSNFTLESYSHQYLVETSSCKYGNLTHDTKQKKRKIPLNPITDGLWHHVALTGNTSISLTLYDGQDFKYCFIDEINKKIQEKKTNNSNIRLKDNKLVNGNLFHIGVDSQYSNFDRGHFYGNMDNILYLKQAFNTLEIQKWIYESIDKQSYLYDKLLLLINLDEYILIDSSSNNLSILIGEGMDIYSPRLIPSTAPILGDLLIIQGKEISLSSSLSSSSSSSSSVNKYLKRNDFYFLEANFTFIEETSEKEIKIKSPNKVKIISCSNLFQGKLVANFNLKYYPKEEFVGNVLCSVKIFVDNNFLGNMNIEFKVISNTKPFVGNGGNALSCDGIDDYLFNADFTWPFSNHTLSNGSIVYGADPITVEYWAYLTTESIKASAIFSIGNGDKASDDTDWYCPLKSCKKGRLSGTAINDFLSSVFRVGSTSKISVEILKYLYSWVFITVVHQQSSGELMKLYLNGQLVFQDIHPYISVGKYSSSSHLSIVPAETLVKSLMVCGWSFWPDLYHKGNLDELRIWNIERTEKEIKDNMYNTLTGKEDYLLGYYNFDDAVQVDTIFYPSNPFIAKDKSKQGYDLIAGGCAPTTEYFKGWNPSQVTKNTECTIITNISSLDKCGRTIWYPSAMNGSEYFDENIGAVYGGFPCYYKIDELDKIVKQTGFPFTLSSVPSFIPSLAPLGGAFFPQTILSNQTTLILLNASDPDGDSLIWYIKTFPRLGSLFKLIHYSSFSLQEISSSSEPLYSKKIYYSSSTSPTSSNSSFLPGGFAFDNFSYYVSDGLLNSSIHTVILHGFCFSGFYLDLSCSCCKPCPIGTFNPSDSLNITSCQLCPEGYYQPLEGQNQCSICPNNYTSSIGASTCEPCPLITTLEAYTNLNIGNCPITISSTENEIVYVALSNIDFPYPGEAVLLLSPLWGDLYEALYQPNGSIIKGDKIKNSLTSYGEPISSYATNILSTNFGFDATLQQTDGSAILGAPDYISSDTPEKLINSAPQNLLYGAPGHLLTTGQSHDGLLSNLKGGTAKTANVISITRNHLPNQSLELEFGNQLIYPFKLIIYEVFRPGTLAAVEMYDSIQNLWIEIYTNEVEVNQIEVNSSLFNTKTCIQLCSTLNPGNRFRLTFQHYLFGSASTIDSVKLIGYRSISDLPFPPIRGSINKTSGFLYSINKEGKGLTVKDLIYLQRRFCHFQLGNKKNTQRLNLAISLVNLKVEGLNNAAVATTAIYTGIGSICITATILLLVFCCVRHTKLTRRAHALEERLDEEINSVPRSSIVPSSEVILGPVLGKGAAGIVYSGKFRGSVVAVKKLLNTQYYSLDDIRGVLEVEAKLMSALRHPNIVLFMACCLENSNLCIISEFCARGSLRDVLETSGNSLSWRLRSKLMLGAAQGLAYLHNCNPPLLHRDIKSQNILVDHSWNAKLADFGTGRFSTVAQVDQQVLLSAAVGTLRWSAPETLNNLSLNSTNSHSIKENKATYGTPADVYSMGIVIWEIASLKLPYENLCFLFEVQQAILANKRPFLEPEWPLSLQNLIQECWDPLPSKRPTAQEVSERLEKFSMLFPLESNDLSIPYANTIPSTSQVQWISKSEDNEKNDSFRVVELAGNSSINSNCITPKVDEPQCTYNSF